MFATWSSAPIGQLLGVTGGALALTTLAPALTVDRTARGTLVADASPGASSAVEMVFVGDGALQGLVGLTAGDFLDTALGSAGQPLSIGWRLDAGTLLQGGAVIASGLPVVGKQDPIGLVLRLSGRTLELYVGRTRIHTHVLSGADAARSWYFGASLASSSAGDLTCVINTGQSAAATAAMLAGGWSLASLLAPPVYLGSEDWLAAETDAVPHARYEGLVTDSGISLISQVVFWPWGDASSATVGEIPLSDPLGRLDAVKDTGSPSVTLRRGRVDGTLAEAQALGRYTLDKVSIDGNADRRLQLRSALDVLDQPLARSLFLPDAGSTLAWTPQPIVIGAVRNAPLAAVNSDGSLQWMGDAPCLVTALRERGRALYRQQDWQADTSRQALRTFSPPSATLYADLSGVGMPGIDLWAGGDAFAGTLGVAKTALASGEVVRYRFTVSGLIAGRILLALTPDPSSAVLAVDANGTYEGVVANTAREAAKLAFIATDANGSVTSILLQRAPDDDVDPAPASLALALREVFRRAQFGAWSIEDAEVIDQACQYAGIGLYVGNTAITARELMRQILPSYAAAEWQDANGVLRLARLVAPSTSAATFALSEEDLTKELSVQPDLAPGLSARMGYRPNAASLGADDFVSDTVAVPAWRRQELSSETQGIVWSGVQLAARYAAAQTMAPVASRFDRREDAQTEIDRVCSLYRQERNFFVATLDASPDAEYVPGQIGTLTYARHGLDQLPVLIRRVSRNPVSGATELTMWG